MLTNEPYCKVLPFLFCTTYQAVIRPANQYPMLVPAYNTNLMLVTSNAWI